MFNLSGSEIMFLLIIGLVVLGPEKLPDAVRRVGRLYAELKRMSSGVQTDLRKVMDEPLKEMMNTTNSMKALFNDTSSQIKNATKDITSPTFVPYSAGDAKTPEIPIVLYDGDDVDGSKDTEQTPTDTEAIEDDQEIAEAIARAAQIANDAAENRKKENIQKLDALDDIS